MKQKIEILEVWRALGGGPIRSGGRARAFWRNGDGWNVVLNAEKDVWFDHARTNGGGILDLVATVRQCDHTEAGKWLREQFGKAAPYQRAKRYTRQTIADAECWAYGYVDNCNALIDEQLALFLEGHDFCVETIAAAVTAIEEIDHAVFSASNALARMYLRHRRKHPGMAAYFVSVGLGVQHELAEKLGAAA